MKLEEYAKKISIDKSVLVSLGLDAEATEGAYAEALRDLMLRVTRDFESLLHPEMGFSVMIEHGYLQDEDIKSIFEVFKAYNKKLREFEVAKLENNLTNWAQEFFKVWDVHKEKIIAINKKLAKNWDRHDMKSLMLEYLG